MSGLTWPFPSEAGVASPHDPTLRVGGLSQSKRFVKTYFNKLRTMISGTSEINTREWIPVKAVPVKADKKKQEAVIESNPLSNKQEV
jgi:hypothetical protein